MDQISIDRYRLEPARIATGSEDDHGVIIRIDGQVTAILVKLEAPYHESDRGFWYLEAGFGPCAGNPPPFERLIDGLLWIAARLDDMTPDLPKLLSTLAAAYHVEAQATFDLDAEAQALLSSDGKPYRGFVRHLTIC